MKPIAFPLSALNPEIRVAFNEEAAGGGKSPVRALSWEELDTPWLHVFFEENSLVRPGPDDLRLRVTLKKEGGLVRVAADVAMRPLLECARSLTPFREEISVRQEAFFSEDAEGIVRPGAERELTEEELAAYPFEGNRVVLDPFLLDVLETALPLVPLCRPDCKGLCASCGEPLNERSACARAGEQATCPSFGTMN